MVYALGVLNLLFLLVGIVALSVVNLSAAGARARPAAPKQKK